jgi:hypothetical protein
MRLILTCAALACAASSSIELTPDNFDALVLSSGKSAFVKFQAPW